MAVSISTITKSAGWARSDVLLALEEAFEIVEFHGATRTGIVTFVTQRNGGELTGNGDDYYNVEASTTSGIGTGATFDIYRNSGVINDIHVNRPGYGYTDGEYLTFDSSLIGGVSATGLGITVSVAGNGSPTSYGSTTTFYQKHVGVGSEYPFGVLRHEIESGKKYGTTYRGFQVWSDFNLSFAVGSAFHPYSPKYTDTSNDNNPSQDPAFNSTDGSSGYQYRFAGQRLVDTTADSDDVVTNPEAAWYSVTDDDGYTPTQNNYASAFRSNQIGSCNPNYTSSFANALRFATTSSPSTHDLKLRTYQSALDPKFTIFSFSQPTVAGSSIDDNVFLTFFFHNYTSSLWDYDYCYNNALTFIRPQRCSNTLQGNSSQISFDTLTHGNFYVYTTEQSPFDSMSSPANLRSAFVGYMSANTNNDSNGRTIFADQYTSTMSSSSSLYNDYNGQTSQAYGYHESTSGGGNAIYARTSNHDKAIYPNSVGSPAELDYNAVIKGIPVCSKMVPCPYYLPDDFVLIDFKYSTSETDFTQGDTITISGSEVYEIIQASYNQSGETSGIALCARRV